MFLLENTIAGIYVGLISRGEIDVETLNVRASFAAVVSRGSNRVFNPIYKTRSFCLTFGYRISLDLGSDNETIGELGESSQIDLELFSDRIVLTADLPPV